MHVPVPFPEVQLAVRGQRCRSRGQIYGPAGRDAAEAVMDRRGLAAGVSAYVIWGTLPVYMKALKHVSPADVVAWRVLSALLFAFIIMAAAGGLEEFIRTLKEDRKSTRLNSSH